ncbi:FeoC-like transcriptional regulator [Streptomyces sp. NPDC057011]|uniref:FeoC-like transcriptional regulator n=1 Tax=unclassified Streptomyces TaxID=2593676 RepID=UPI003644405C
MSGPGRLRRLLREFEEAAPGEGLPQIAARLGISPSEAADLAGYWVRKGRLKREEIGAPECDGCFFAGRGCATACPDGPSRPALITLSPVRERRR